MRLVLLFAMSAALGISARNNIGVIVYAPMKSGLLSGAMTAERIAALPKDDWRRNHAEFQEPRLSQNLRLVEMLRAIGAKPSLRLEWRDHPQNRSAARCAARHAARWC